MNDAARPAQQQDPPGLTGPMTPQPDHGEQSYVGHGLLDGRRALITGGDSGIGRAVAIAFAREGADVAIGYLAEEQEDADETARWVREAGRACVLVPRGIRVNAVAPGPIWTPLQPATQPPEKVAKFGQDTPLGRAGEPAEVAPAFVFLASSVTGSYVSGTVLGVTGGKPVF